MTVEALISELLKQSYFFRATGGGVTFSGGEATVQIDFLEAISSHLYDLGIDMAIETSGYFDWQACHRVLERMDHLYFDLKMMDSEDHKSFCGVDNDLILKNLVKASTLGIDLTIRLIVIEGVHEGDDPFYKVVEFLKTQQIKAKLELMPYHRYGDGKYDLLDLSRPPEDYKTPTKERLTHLKALFEKNGYMTCFDL